MDELDDLPAASDSAEGLPESKSSSPCVVRSARGSDELNPGEKRESPDRNDSGAEESLVNPPPPAELGEDVCAMLRGDAIGNTAYTQRWVLNTLLVITQALPYYLAAEAEPVPDVAFSQENEDSKNMDTEDPSEEAKGADGLEEGRPAVLELAEDVESAACQLWDMTVEPDVVIHLLDLGAVDILQLATDIITLSRAPRLTEVVVGVVANMSCQPAGCKRIINHQALLNACLALPQTTDDVPTLIEAFRFLRLLLWHLNHRIPMSSRSGCPLTMALKGHEALKVALVFILKNSLSETLLSSLFQFLEILLYLWLPEDQGYMAAHYAESGLVEGIVEVMRHFLKQAEKNGCQELPKEVHKGILILYSFVGTHASHLISSFDQYESLLEPIVVSYVEHIAKVENTEELLEDENAERLTYALGLCELLVPTMRHPNILSSIGKLLVLTHGANYRHGTPLEKNLQAAPNLVPDRRSQRKLRRSRSRKSRSSQEQMETESSIPEQDTKEERGQDERGTEAEGPQVQTDPFDGKGNEGLTSSVASSQGPADSSSSTAQELPGAVACEKVRNEASGSAANDPPAANEAAEKNSKTGKLNSLIESLTDYCVRALKYPRDLSMVLSAINECHVHEVQYFFRVVRSREPKLVGDIQEKLLDTGSHNRLVTILADMYS